MNWTLIALSSLLLVAAASCAAEGPDLRDAAYIQSIPERDGWKESSCGCGMDPDGVTRSASQKSRQAANEASGSD
jgi:hypothetical protein